MSLRGSCVRQHTLAVGIAYGVNFFASGLEIVISDDATSAVGVYACFGASVRNDSSASHSHQYCRSADFGVTAFRVSILDVEYASIGIAAYSRDASTDDKFDAASR